MVEVAIVWEFVVGGRGDEIEICVLGGKVRFEQICVQFI